jgi:hypothetical protein
MGGALAEPASGPVAAAAKTLAGEYSTGFHLGDALYRDLLNQTVVNAVGQHWHTAVFCGFDYEAGQGCMLAVNAGGNLAEIAGITDCIFKFSASRSLADPEADVAGSMKQLRDDFILAFAEQNQAVPFHESRRPPGLTPAQRRAIAATACAMLKKDIRYIPDDMLNYKWNDYDDWTGEIEAIWNIRCDGVVEYCYEKNGVKVCNGINQARWNITKPGGGSLDNHNSFHTGSYDPGELCPRIQAGDQSDPQHRGAHDTTFVANDPAVPPAIADFAVTVGSSGAVLSFRVLTAAYDQTFVRVTVSKDGGNYSFVRTEGLPAGTDPSAIVADWQFQVVPVGEVVHAYWMGKTAGGPDYKGQDGDFTFRVVAVDCGGNVSALLAVTQNIQWP